MTTAADSDLQAINHAIGEAESAADRGFFERLLAPAFSMVRPDGTRFDDRAGFLDALTVSPARMTRVDDHRVRQPGRGGLRGGEGSAGWAQSVWVPRTPPRPLISTFAPERRPLPAGRTPRPLQRPFGRCDETASVVSYTSSGRSHDVSEFSAPTGSGHPRRGVRATRGSSTISRSREVCRVCGTHRTPQRTRSRRQSWSRPARYPAVTSRHPRTRSGCGSLTTPSPCGSIRTPTRSSTGSARVRAAAESPSPTRRCGSPHHTTPSPSGGCPDERAAPGVTSCTARDQRDRCQPTDLALTVGSPCSCESRISGQRRYPRHVHFSRGPAGPARRAPASRTVCSWASGLPARRRSWPRSVPMRASTSS